MNLDLKFIISLIAVLLTIIGYVPYFRDIFNRRTKPHMFTWLIWMITQGTATFALLYGGGKFGSLSMIVGTMLVFVVFLLSFKYGTKDITRSDKYILSLALLSIIIWWQLDTPLLAVFMVTAIDSFGYIPTIRKSLTHPWDETLSFWGIMAIVCILSIISNAEYNLLTVMYLGVLFVLNIIVIIVCLYKRMGVKNIKN